MSQTMATITAKDVAALRAQTGAGMMDCKKALEETGGDMAKAVEWLRAHGIAKSEKRADRVVIYWPSGATETLTNLDADRGYCVREGSGPVSCSTLRPRPAEVGGVPAGR